MSAVVLQIADAVTAAINAAQTEGSFAPQVFTAARYYLPVYDLRKDLASLKVSVVPKALSLTSVSRSSDDFMYQIDVGIHKRYARDAITNDQINAECDPLLFLMEQVIDLFRGKALAAVSGVQCMGIENPAIFIPQDIDEDRVLTTFATLSFKLVRPRP